MDAVPRVPGARHRFMSYLCLPPRPTTLRAPQIRKYEYDQDGQELQAHAPAHERLAEVRAGATQHVPQSGEQHQEDGGERRQDQVTRAAVHACGPRGSDPAEAPPAGSLPAVAASAVERINATIGAIF